MDIREKLVELLDEVLDECELVCERSNCPHFPLPSCVSTKQAYYLIANGVTVQEWISVVDRMPEKNSTVIAADDNGIVFQCLYAYDGWDLWDGNTVNITHWMPLPQPPKGE